MLTILLQIQTAPQTVDFTWLFIKMIIILLVICASALFILKYILPRTNIFQRLQKNGGFEITGRQMLGPRKFLCIAKVEERRFLLGVSDHSINLIAELSKSGKEI